MAPEGGESHYSLCVAAGRLPMCMNAALTIVSELERLWWRQRRGHNVERGTCVQVCESWRVGVHIIKIYCIYEQNCQGKHWNTTEIRKENRALRCIS